MDTVEIDGAGGEGGGQIVRTAAALAVLAGKRLVVDDVRGGRSTPGLRPQHVAALDAVAQACNGHLAGADVGSRRIEFTPGKLSGGSVTVETETAANVCLVLHAIAPLAAGLDEPVTLQATGGTDTRWAPTLGHVREVFVPLAQKAGTRIELIGAREGFYPKGGGGLRARIHPARRPSGWGSTLDERGTLEQIEIHVRSAQLPDHVARRVGQSAREHLAAAGYDAVVEATEVEAPSPGVVVDAVARCEHTVLGSNALGERGVASEVVGKRCARALVAELESAATVDVHAGDQLVALLADQPGAGFITRELTGHLTTQLRVLEQILDVEATVSGHPGGRRVTLGSRTR